MVHAGSTGKLLVLIAVATAAAATACSSAPLTQIDGYLALGTWGGSLSGMIVGDTAMHLHVGCTYGDVSGRIPVDSSGHFDVTGSYMLHAYPIAVGPAVPARFTGQVKGDVATITVMVNDTVAQQNTVLGPVTLRLGDPPEMGPCPICRRTVHTHRRLSRVPGA